MKKWILPLTLAAGVLTLSACNNASEDAEEIVAKSDAGNITKNELYEEMKGQVGEQTLQQLLYMKVLSEKHEVTDEELDKKVDEIKEQAGDNFELVLQQYQLDDEAALREFLKQQLLIEKVAFKDVKVTEDETKEHYEGNNYQIRASHILVKDEATAKEVKGKLDAGEDFAELAKEFGQDGTAETGGDLNYFGKGMMVPEFETAAYALEENVISDPVKTEHGWHIIKVTDKPAYEEIKDELEYEVKLSKINPADLQTNLQKELEDANVDIKDKDLQGFMQAQS